MDELTRATKRFKLLARLLGRDQSSRFGDEMLQCFLDEFNALDRRERNSLRFWIRQTVDMTRGSWSFRWLALARRLTTMPPGLQGAAFGVVVGFTFMLGGVCYNRTGILSSIPETQADLVCAIVFLVSCLGASWMASKTRKIRDGGLAAGTCGGVIGFATGLAYLLLYLCFGPYSAHEHSISIHTAQLPTQFLSLAILVLTATGAGIILGVATSAARINFLGRGRAS